MAVDFILNRVTGRTIEEAWSNAIWLTGESGNLYRVGEGSYTGQLRLQLPYFTGVITEPGTRPLAPFVSPYVPSPTTDEKIDQYFAENLMYEGKSENQDYTYGQYIAKQIDTVIELLNRSKGMTNQAVITVGDTSSILLENPPCLKAVSFKVVEQKLNVTVYFRSWDLVAGMPENLGGIQLLKEYVLGELNFNVEDGSIIAFSDGLHIYEQYFDLIKYLCVSDGKIRGYEYGTS